MKSQTCITVDEELMKEIEEKLKDGSFRNKSHVFEYAVRRLLRKISEQDSVENNSAEENSVDNDQIDSAMREDEKD